MLACVIAFACMQIREKVSGANHDANLDGLWAEFIDTIKNAIRSASVADLVSAFAHLLMHFDRNSEYFHLATFSACELSSRLDGFFADDRRANTKIASSSIQHDQ